MSLVGDDQTLWAKDCVSQIKEQNKVNSAFEDVIGLYNSMVEKEKKLYYANVAKEEQNNVLRKKIADLEESISQNSQDTDGIDVPQLRRELKDGLERVAVLSETIVARGQKLKELELEESNLRNQVEEANKLVEEKENLYVERIKKKEESDVMYNTLYDALLQSQIKLVKVEEKMRDDRKENKQIKMKYQQKMEDNNKTLHSVVSQSFSTSLSEMLPALFSTPESTSLLLSKSDLVIEQPAATPEEPTLPCKARENFQIFSGEINSICFSKSGSQLVMGGDDQICRVWDTNPFKLKQQLTGADRSIMCVDFSKNEELVLASSIDHSIRVYTLKIGRIKYNLMGHLGRVFAAKFTEDSKQIFSGSYDKTFRIWDITRGFCNKTIWCNSSCNDLVINGQQIISAHTDKALRFWDVASGKATHEATDLHNLQISGLALSPDGNTVLTCSNDKTLKLVDIRTYGVVSSFTHENYVSSLPNMRCCFSPNGKNICTGGDDGSIFIWDVNNPKEAAKKFGKRVHKNAVLCVSWTGGINGASNLLASCDKSGTFALWG